MTVTGERNVGNSEDTGLKFLWNGSGRSSSAILEIQTNGGVIGIKG